MALITCTDCKAEVSDKAAACPKCGHPISTPSISDKEVKRQQIEFSKGTKIVLPLLAVVVVGFYAVALPEMFSGMDNPAAESSTTEQRKSDEDEKLGEAYTLATELVKKQLRSPSTAEFPTKIDYNMSYPVKALDDGRYKVVSYVDYGNPSGGTVRANYTCVMQWNGEKWKLLDFNIEEQ